MSIEIIRMAHRQRRYAIKQQSRMDRALESFIRINYTDWTWSEDEESGPSDADRARWKKQVEKIIKDARDDRGDPEVIELVKATDAGRAPFDKVRKDREKKMEQLAASLPAVDWIKSIHGAGLLGLATIVGEAGDLSNYSNPSKLWKRLGFAPYQGLAGSSWKRKTWRPRALTDDEWIANPFSGEKYGLMHQIAIWLVNAQWIGAKKVDDGSDEGKPNGPYGQIYYERRQHTFQTHPDWTKQHRRMDALRITMKAFLKELLLAWHAAEKKNAVATPALKPRTLMRPRAPDRKPSDTQEAAVGRAPKRKSKQAAE